MERAVAEEKTCVLIVVPGAQFGPGRDSPFPENAFNETWVPHVPSVKPAFKDIALTWESDYPHACQAELLKRVGALLSRRLGHSVIHDVKVGATFTPTPHLPTYHHHIHPPPATCHLPTIPPLQRHLLMAGGRGAEQSRGHRAARGGQDEG